MPKTTPTAMAAKPDASFVRSPSPYGGSKAVIRDLRNYLAGQVVGITRDEALLDEILKCAFCRVSLERRGVTTNSMSEDAVAALYGQTFGDLHQKLYFLDLGSDLRLGPPHIAKVDQALSGLRILDPARDVVGDLYETFAGQSIRGQEGQFFTPKNAVQALVAMVRPTSSDLLLDPACGAGAFLLEAARFAQNAEGTLPRLSGIDKDAYLARLARIHVALQFGIEPSVACANSLASLRILSATTGYGRGEHSAVLTNPPFGSKIVAVAGPDRAHFALAHKWKKQPDGCYVQTATLAQNTAPQILFVERCLDLLADEGRLGIVLPESALSK